MNLPVKANWQKAKRNYGWVLLTPDNFRWNISTREPKKIYLHCEKRKEGCKVTARVDRYFECWENTSLFLFFFKHFFAGFFLPTLGLCVWALLSTGSQFAIRAGRFPNFLRKNVFNDFFGQQNSKLFFGDLRSKSCHKVFLWNYRLNFFNYFLYDLLTDICDL